VRAGFGGGVHAMLWNFVDAARGRFLVNAVEVIQRTGTLANRKSLFDGLCHVRFRQQYRFS
jgi:hypothetical protein